MTLQVKCDNCHKVEDRDYNLNTTGWVTTDGWGSAGIGDKAVWNMLCAECLLAVQSAIEKALADQRYVVVKASMNEKAIKWALQQNVESSEAQSILVILASLVNEHGYSLYSYSKIAKKCNIKMYRIPALMRKMEESGLLTRPRNRELHNVHDPKLGIKLHMEVK